MRILTLLINDNNNPEIASKGSNGNINLIIQLIFCFILSLSFCSQSRAQWVSDPGANLKLVQGSSDPINISSVKDFNGGAFIFWQDSRAGSTSQVYFIHVNAAGNATFPDNGKNISVLNTGKENPVTAQSLPNTALAAWKEAGKYGRLFVQRFSSGGLYLWKNEGLVLTDSTCSVSGYSAASDNLGNVYVSYISRQAGLNSNYSVEYRKITSDGKFVSDTASVISTSADRKSQSSVVPDNLGGAFVYWLEYVNNKSVLLLRHINVHGQTDWGKNPLPVSDAGSNVINYKALSFESRDSYVAWQVLNQDKDIYHQVVTAKGKSLWGDGGRPVTKQKGNQINPNVVTADSTIYVSWTDDFRKDQDVYIQRFNRSGEPLWQKSGVSVIGINGSQFGQRIIRDGRDGVILGWIDRRQDSARANIYVQKINAGGSKMWDSLGVPAASHFNSPKSYLNLVSDDNGGVIAVFRENRGGKKEIYGQRIFNSGVYASKIADFEVSLTGDSVKVSWYYAAQSAPPVYSVERAVQADSGSLKWKSIRRINSGDQPGKNHYIIFDRPGAGGTYYYRIIAGKPGSDTVTSGMERIDLFTDNSKVILAQNSPNPFSDSTSIRFFLPEKDSVTLEFYNGHLEKINELKKTFPAGENTVPFSAKGLEPGIYFYRLKTGDFVDVKKMIITKRING